MNILVIYPRVNRDQFTYDPNDVDVRKDYVFQTGIPYITAYIKANGYKVDTLNLNHESGHIRDVIKKALTAKHYDIVFSGGLSLFYRNFKDMVTYIREASPSTKIVLGGGLISGSPKLMIKLLKPDIGVILEGEYTCLDIIRTLKMKGDLNDVRGIGFFENGEVIVTPQREPITNLDSLPLPDYESFGFNEYLDGMRPSYVAWDSVENPRPYPIVASRGCPFRCTFCFHTTGSKYRQRSIESVTKEIYHAIVKYRANVIFFYDELFAYDKERALKFCALFKQIRTDHPVHIMANLRVDCADDEILDALKDAGCTVVGLGLESASPTVLKSMKKNTTPEQIADTVKRISDRRMSIQGSFIFGDPAETLETAKETCDFIMKHRDIIRDGAMMTFIIVFPGTPDYKYCLDNGIIKDEVDYIENQMICYCDPHNPINMTKLSDRDFKKLTEMVWRTDYLNRHWSKGKMLPSGTILAKCPYCRSDDWFVNAKYPSNVGCHLCRGRYRVDSLVFPFSQRLVKLFGFTRLRRLRYSL